MALGRVRRPGRGAKDRKAGYAKVGAFAPTRSERRLYPATVAAKCPSTPIVCRMRHCIKPIETPAVWRDIGRDLARLHTGVDRDGPGAALGEREALPDPRRLAEDLASGGWITSSEARWFVRWLDRIAPAATAPAEASFSHGDVQSIQ